MRGRRRAGVHEQRHVARLQAGEQRGEPHEADLAGERAGRHGRADRAAVEQRVDLQRARAGGGQRRRGPEAERVAELGDAVVEGVQQRLGLGGRQQLDPERDRQRDPDRSMPSRSASSARATGSWSASATGHGGSPGSSRIQPPAPWRSRGGADAPGERADQRVGPEVLVQVGSGHGLITIPDFLDQIGRE